MAAAQMSYEKENEGCREQCPRNDEGYRIDSHGGRFRIRTCAPEVLSTNARPFGANRSFRLRQPPGSRSPYRACACVFSLFERTQSQNANARLVSKSASGVVPKIGSARLSSVYVRIAVVAMAIGTPMHPSVHTRHAHWRERPSDASIGAVDRQSRRCFRRPMQRNRSRAQHGSCERSA